MTSDDVSRLLASFAALVAVSTVMGMATSEYMTLSFCASPGWETAFLTAAITSDGSASLPSLPSVTMNFLELAS